MRLLDRYKKRITFRVDKPKEIVCFEISKCTKVKSVDTNNIQIIIKPTFFDPFAGRGFINLQLSEDDNGTKTIIQCELVPTSITQNGIYVFLFLLSFWTLVALLISHNFYSFLTVAFGWTMLIAVLHLAQTLNRGKLESYIRFIISSIKPQTQKANERNFLAQKGM